MFTTDQIKQAHSKVESGADFPAYIQEIKTFGVKAYETYVSDGHTDYHGDNGFSTSAPGKYNVLHIADTSNTPQFIADLKAHQQGHSDYLSFIQSCATFGVEKWKVSIEKMTCTYFDKAGNVMLVENIPQ
jgi:uncharacterized protein YbcV (DUF1398 family)